MLINVLFLVGLAVAVVMLTNVVVRGIELLAEAGNMSSKAKGQLLGYSTSLPELVGTVGTAAHGLLGAGLWNIASSNCINWGLFALAALYHRRFGAMFQRRFIDEASFAGVALVVPLLLSTQKQWSQSPWVAGLLFAGFLGYIVIDRRLNPDPPASVAATRSTRMRKVLPRAIGLSVLGIIGIIIAGRFLGEVANTVVRDVGVPEWAVGWILGVVTSLPEMTAFFAVFATAKREAWPDDADCQENLDSLAASNMSNLGLIYPIGVTVFLVFTQM